MRDIYEIRERSSRMYHWSALTTAQIVMELPWNILGSTLSFLCWYWTVGFEPSRAGFTYLMYAVCFPIYYTTIALAVASMSPTAEIADHMVCLLYSFVIILWVSLREPITCRANQNVCSEGVVQPFRLLGWWWRWMYYLSPYTYLMEAILGQGAFISSTPDYVFNRIFLAIGDQLINCSNQELVTLEPPSGQTCGEFMARYISRSGGYLTNPDASTTCHFCSSRTTDEWMEPSFNIFYQNHWRDFGLFCAYIIFNVNFRLFSSGVWRSIVNI